jgi:glycosyltransferase involved in cell wall biosynthesis
MSPVRASVVIGTRDRPDLLGECLASVSRARSPRDEIIVVDSASADPRTVASVAAQGGASLVRSARPGSARARNLGASQARGEILAFTDDDALVEPEWLDALEARFADPSVAAVVGPVFEIGAPEGTLLFAYSHFDAAREVVRFDRTGDGWFRRLRLGAIGSGANLAVRRSVFERLGPFRESLGCGAPISGDENYFLLTLVAGGNGVVSDPAVRVRHPPQSVERLRELARCQLAYALYVGLTRPELRQDWLALAASKLRFGRRRGGHGGAAQASPGGLLQASQRLLAARRIDRETKERSNGGER